MRPCSTGWEEHKPRVRRLWSSCMVIVAEALADRYFAFGTALLRQRDAIVKRRGPEAQRWPTRSSWTGSFSASNKRSPFWLGTPDPDGPDGEAARHAVAGLTRS